MKSKKLHIAVLAKQVPDTHNVGKEAMKENGTINRAALPAIFNPDDLKALEMALTCKDLWTRTPENKAEVTVITMGPPRAAEIIRESLYRGADRGIIVCDKRFAGSDTLATSYALSLAIRKTGPMNIVFTGRQAIDGDTAQIGPQTAEKLGIPQITYAEEIITLTNNNITVRRCLERGIEIVKSNFPVLITVHGNAKDCRPRRAERVIIHKKACSASEAEEKKLNMETLWKNRPFLKIEEWCADDLNPEYTRLGLNGSPTKVKSIENVVLTGKENKIIDNCENDIHELMRELIKEHII